ncbi:Uncharacterised protein [uncultured archaeon]|nr:Uncharacterised protein [uncultured archaeon]
MQTPILFIPNKDLQDIRNIFLHAQPKSFDLLLCQYEKLEIIVKDFQKKYQIETLRETLYCLCHEEIPEVCTCGKRKKFYNYTKGYWQTCGSKECRNRVRSENEKKYFQEHPEVMQQAQLRTQQTLLKTYGVKNCSQLQEIKDKKITTSLRNNGVKYPHQSEKVQEQFKQTCLRIYGTENPHQNAKVIEKTRKTCQDRFGVDCVLQSEEIKEKIKQDNLAKHGVAFSSQVHIPPQLLIVLQNKNLLEQSLQNTTVKELAKQLSINASTVYDYIHQHQIRYSSPNFSSYEQEIREWLTNHSINFESNVQNIISPQELDIYIPTHKLAIEFDGLYWHSESGGKDKWYHWNKTKKCQEKGIRLIHIFEDEWMKKKEICLDLLSRFLNLPMQRAMARKCSFQKVSSHDAKKFLKANHLQGFASAKVYLGLYFQRNLIQLLSFSPARYSQKIEWENIRFCNKIGFQVIGGLEKLWKHFLKEYHPQSVVSYCDLRWFAGSSYRKLGFFLANENDPQYYYTDHQSRWHRSMFTQKKCVHHALELENYPQEILEKMTEKQIAYQILHLDRIWDSGQETWIWYL